MADTLASIYQRAIAKPEANRFLNLARAASLEREVAATPGKENLQLRYLLAQERILGGATQEGIAELERLRAEAHLSLSARAPENKPFFDLLGIAYLRLAEQENCATNSAASICIIPFAQEAQHARQEGARKAIALYEELVGAFPDDIGSRWLLNIASMAIGSYPERVPAAMLIPGIAPRAGSHFPQFHNVAGQVGLALAGLSGGLSVEDFNHDGLLDLFMTAFGPSDSPHLFLADGGGGYLDRTATAGLAAIAGGLNNTHADYDNDGNEDIFVMRGAWLGDAGAYPPSLLHNRGDGTFEDVTFAAGLASFHPTHSAAWADFNLDGWLDLFVGHESLTRGSHPSALFVNNGDGTFTDVSRRVHLDVDAFVKGATWGDVNNDGLPDLFVSVLGAPNHLYLNRGGRSLSAWRFEEVPLGVDVALPVMSFATWFWDVDQDGWQDLLVLSYDTRNTGSLHEAVAREYLGLPLMTRIPGGSMQPVEPSRLYRNNGDGTFADVTREAGLEDKAIFAMGANFGDLDNDGWLDFYVGTGDPDLRSVIPNRMFRNLSGKRFEEVSLEGGFAHIQKGHATAFADLDGDGDEDIYMVMGGAYQGDRFASILFENPGWPGSSWITLELQGTSANRSAIGARVAIDASDSSGVVRTLYRTVGTGGSFGAGSLQLHVGLGHSTRIRQVRIQWPDAARTRTSYGGLEIDAVYHIVQGQAPVRLARPAVPFRSVLPVSPHHDPRE